MDNLSDEIHQLFIALDNCKCPNDKIKIYQRIVGILMHKLIIKNITEISNQLTQKITITPVNNHQYDIIQDYYVNNKSIPFIVSKYKIKEQELLKLLHSFSDLYF